MANQIQVKRSTTTRQPGVLTFGEFGYTTNGDILWIGQDAGDTSNVVAIGGKRVPGTLTANQAIVVDGGLFIDTLKVGNSTVNAVVNSTSIKVQNSTVNSTFSVPTSAQYSGNFFLHANGSWATPAGGLAGANTQVQFNDSGAAGASAGLTFDKTTNNLTVANTLLVPIVGANVTHVGNSSVTAATVTGNSTVTEVKISSSVANVQSASIALAGTTTTVSSNAVFNANIVQSGAVANLNATNFFHNGTAMTVGSNATFNANVTIAGDLIVNGTTFTVNVDTITVEDSLIKLASNNLTTNTIDIGVYGVFGNSTVTRYTGLFRDTSNAGIWTLFSALEPEPTTTVDTANNTFTRGSLLANFVTEVFSANSTKVSITGGALNADLEVQDGGTGGGTWTAKGVFYGNTTGPFGITAAGTDGQVLQANSTGFPVFAMLDGGFF